MDNLAYLKEAYSFLQDPALKVAIDEIERLQRYESMVHFIASDYLELSYEKAQWQRDDWRKRCVKTIEQDYKDDQQS